MFKTCVVASSIALAASLAWADDEESDTSAAEDFPIALADHTLDAEAAERIFRRSCRACHGNRAQGAASYPKLSDKDPDYIAEKLVIYRSGEKIGPNSILMIQHARPLSDEDIANISLYIATAFDE